VRHRDADANATVSGVGASFFRVRGVAVTAGRPFGRTTSLAVAGGRDRPGSAPQLFLGTRARSAR